MEVETEMRISMDGNKEKRGEGRTATGKKLKGQKSEKKINK